MAFKKLLEQYNLTQDRLSERIGRKRATIANFLRLLKLPAEVQLGLRDRRVDMGHARALLSLDNPSLQLRLYNNILKDGLSVRKVEEIARKWNAEAPDAEPKAKTPKPKQKFDILEKHLSQRFNAPVGVKYDSRGVGHITFNFRNDDELEKLIRIFDAIS